MHQRLLGDPERATALYFDVPGLAENAKSAALAAARELDALLEPRAAPRSAAAYSSNWRSSKATATRGGARSAMPRWWPAVTLGDPDRAVRAWRARLHDDDQDAEALDGLCSGARSRKPLGRAGAGTGKTRRLGRTRRGAPRSGEHRAHSRRAPRRSRRGDRSLAQCPSELRPGSGKLRSFGGAARGRAALRGARSTSGRGGRARAGPGAPRRALPAARGSAARAGSAIRCGR